jgi:sec-independent protein translocase protein TatA
MGSIGLLNIGPIPGIGVPELVIILIVVLIIFGPKNLPKLGSALGKATKNLKEGMGAGKKKKAEEAEQPAAGTPVETETEEVEEIAVEAEELPAGDEETPNEETPKKRVVKVVKKSE